MIPQNWTSLQSAVENQNCILLLGPGASGSMVDEVFVPFTVQFARKLVAELNLANIDFDNDNCDDLDYVAQLYLNNPNCSELEAAYTAKKFYEKNALIPPDFLVKLANLPFKIVVNTTPDDLFMAAFQAAGKIGRTFDFYNYWRPKEYKFEKPDIDKPLVFNLFGHYSTPESLVLTANNQVDFISKVNRDNPPLPARLLEEFDGSKTFLFVGFDWREWHTQLLMKTLRLTKDSTILSPTVKGFEPSRSGREIFTSLFKKFIFAEDHLEDFVTDLSARFAVESPKTTIATAGKKVFISYLPSADDGLKDLIFNHLRPIELAGLAHFWHEEMLAFGENRAAKITSELGQSDIILMLVTAEYLSDDTILADQFLPAMARTKAGNAMVVPVILKPSPWQLVDALKTLPTILPNPGGQPGKAVSTWTNQDEAFQNVVENFKNLLK